MYPVSANFHTLSVADAPKTRVRIYFIGSGVDCWDDNDVQTNGTLLVGAVGDTDSNGRIGQDGITFSEIYNKDQNISVGGSVSYQIEMMLLNSDGALDNFAFGRCKVYLDVYDAANSAWLPCPMGVYTIDLPVKRKVQLISCSGYDQMQSLDLVADTWWSGLNFSGGLTIANILNSMVTELGLHLSLDSSSAMVNSSLSFTAAPFDSIERTYRDILNWIAEATATIARFNRDGELDMRPFVTPQINSSNIVIDTDTTGNQCFSVDITEYRVEQIDGLVIKLSETDQGVETGSSGTRKNKYTIWDNPFLYGASVAEIQNKLWPIYARLNQYSRHNPIITRLIADWSIEAGDIIYITRDSTTYRLPIFQQKMVWRGGYVVSELISTGDKQLPKASAGNVRETYRYDCEMATKVGDNEIISKINQTPEAITIQASKVNLTGYVTFTNLSTSGQTVIDGGNITTGTIDASAVTVNNINASNITSGTLSANRIAAGSLAIGKLDSAAQNTINGANSQEQLIYRSKVAGTTTLSGTTSWVTDTTGNQDTWTLKRPTYNSSYPVLFVATQRKDVGGTVTCTTPQIDNTTTVIDGGHITTGTIDASVVSVTNLNASNITSGSLSANYIQGGIMTVGGLNNTNGYIRILDSTGNYAGGVGASGVSIQGEEPFSGLSHVLSNSSFYWGYSIYDQTTQKQLANIDSTVVNATDEYSDILLYGYDNGTQVSRVEFSAYPYNNGAYLILQGQNGLIRLNSDGTYAGDLTIQSGGNLTVNYGNLTVGGNETISGVLDVEPRRCQGTLTSASWYRAIIFNAASANDANGYAGSTIDINIGRPSQNETHKIRLNIVNGRIRFNGEESVSYSQLIDKIRYWIDGDKGYVDIHCTGAADNVYVDFAVHDRYTRQSLYVAGTLINVGASPTGSLAAEYTFSSMAYNKPISAEGTINGWDYILYADKTIDATRKITGTVSNYTTVNGFYGYYIANIATPFTMANTDYYIGTEWAIGNGFSVPAAVMSKTTSKFNAYALGTASGSQSVSLTMHIKGTIA